MTSSDSYVTPGVKVRCSMLDNDDEDDGDDDDDDDDNVMVGAVVNASKVYDKDQPIGGDGRRTMWNR
jgi:hypothetical protein